MVLVLYGIGLVDDGEDFADGAAGFRTVLGVGVAEAGEDGQVEFLRVVDAAVGEEFLHGDFLEALNGGGVYAHGGGHGEHVAEGNVHLLIHPQVLFPVGVEVLVVVDEGAVAVHAGV